MISFLVRDTAEVTELLPSCLITDYACASVVLCRAEDQTLLWPGATRVTDVWRLQILLVRRRIHVVILEGGCFAGVSLQFCR